MKNKTLLLTFLMLLSFSVSFAQNQIWAKRWNQMPTNSDDKLIAMTTDNAGNVYVTGYVTTQITPVVKQKIITIKYNSSGTQIWKATHNPPYTSSYSEQNAGYAIAISYESGVPYIYVTGTEMVDVNLRYHEMIVLKYEANSTNPAGNMVWTSPVYEGNQSLQWNYSSESGTAIAVDGNNNIYITGYRNESTSTGYSMGVVWGYDKNGISLGPFWSWNTNGVTDAGNDIKLDIPNNCLYATGYSSSNAYLVKMQLGTGFGWLWDYTWTNPTYSGQDVGSAVSIAPGGANIYVAGFTYNGTTQRNNGLILKFSSSVGPPSLTVNYNSTYNLADEFRDIEVPSTTEIYVTGYMQKVLIGVDLDWLTIKYDALFNLQSGWPQTFDDGMSSPEANGGDFANAIIVSPNTGKVYVYGQSNSPLTDVTNIRTIRYAATGGVYEWTKYYDYAVLTDQPGGKNSIALTFDDCHLWDNVYVCGASQNPGTGYDCVTIKYALTGPCSGLGEGEGKMMSGSITSESQGTVFPNPFNEKATFKFGNGGEVYANASFIIYDVTGKEVKRIENLYDYQFEIDMIEFDAGIYFYKYVQGETMIASGKFVISQ